MERISEGEQRIMEVLWRETPLAASEVFERVGPGQDWSISTVKTLLARLVTKGAIAHAEDGNRFLYRPLVTREQFLREETGRLVDRLCDGRAAPLVAQLAESGRMSAQDIQEIEALLKALRP
jgi:BlaI family transcriptional regulator, penicillinase repressor